MLIHIVSEVMVLVGLTFYFTQKNKKLGDHIEDLAQRVEEQEDLLQKHEQIIKRLVDHITKQELQLQKQQSLGSRKLARHHPSPMGIRSLEHKVVPRRETVAKSRYKKQSPKTAQISFAEDTFQELVVEEESQESDEEDLDTLLAKELEDLEDNNEDNLKKEPLLNKDVK